MLQEPRANKKFTDIDSDMDEKSGARRARPRGRREIFARGLSLLALMVVSYLAINFASAGYYALTDAFVAPLILSPDSDLVLPSKLHLARLHAERSALVGRIEQASALMSAAEEGDRKLAELRDVVKQGLAWAESMTSSSVRSGSRDLSRVGEQLRLIHDRISEQQHYLGDLEHQMAAGLVRKSDLMRERDVLNQLRVVELQKERETLESSTQLKRSKKAARSLRGEDSEQPMTTPELVQHRDQLTRLEVDLLKLAAEQQARTSELRNARHELSKLDELIQHIKARPVFRAIDSRQNVAFVPYTQSEAIARGAQVYECRLWGMFFCRMVGTVTQLLPGEVAAHDPWGALARGQYALLKLSIGEAAKAKVLRIRGAGAPDPVADGASSTHARAERTP